MKGIFLHLDADKSGTVDLAEEMEAFMNLVDNDGDGSVDITEIANLFLGTQTSSKPRFFEAVACSLCKCS